MIITKCHVQDFGKLHEFELDLNKGLNKISEENGWGKSTFATFLKAILFGMNSTTKKDIDENERLKYTPWDKNKFGGYVEFELDGKRYRLERFFGTKANQDSATLYDLDLNKPCQTYTPNIMEEYFGINAETFQKSTYISQGKITTDINDGIREKLGNLLEDETENNFLRAIDLVVEKRKEKQLFKGKGGEIEEIRAQIDDTTKKLSSALENKTLLEQKQAEFEQQNTQIEQIKAELQDIEKQLKILDQQHTKSAEIEHYESLQKQLEKIKLEYEENLKFFNNQIPDKLTLERTQIDINNFNQKQAQLGAYPDTNKTEFEGLNRFFAKHVPTDQEIEKYVEIANEISKKENQNFEYFEQPIRQPIHQTNFQFYSILGIFVIVLGIVLCAFLNPIIGASISGVGVVCLIVGIVFATKQKHKFDDEVKRQNLNKQRQIEDINKSNAKRHNEVLQLKDSLNQFISLFLTPTTSPLFDLSIIKSKKDQYENLKHQQQKNQQQKDNLNAELIAIKNTLDRFFAIYFEDQTLGYQNMLNSLEFKLSNFNRLKAETLEQTQKLEDYVKQKNIDPTQKISQADLQKYNILSQQKTIQTNRLNELGLLQAQTLANIKTLNQSVFNIDILENDLKNLKEKSTAVLKEVEVLDNVKKYLELANETLTSKYLSPMTQKFSDYLEMLSSQEFGKISIDTNMNLTFEQKGGMHDKKYLSAGLRDIVDLCMRFSLIDSIFAGEKPPIILDDPFVNLDEKNIRNGLELIEKISKDKQIIYFSCHSSRS